MSAAEADAMPSSARPRRTMLAAGVPPPVAGQRPVAAPSPSSIPPDPPALVAEPASRSAAPPRQMPAASSPGLGATPESSIRPGSVRIGSGRSPTMSRPPSRYQEVPPPATRPLWPLLLAILVLAGAGAATLVLVLTGS